jgi:hypothetical protein
VTARLHAPSIRRRPSGEPPPLPRAGSRRGWWLVTAAFVLVALWFLVTVIGGEASWLARFDAWLLDRVNVGSSLAGFARAVQHALDPLSIGALTVVLVVGLLVFRRLRILVLIGVSLVVADVFIIGMQHAISAPRPYDVEILGSWSGYASPSTPLSHLTVLLVGAVLGFAPAGSARRAAEVVAALALALVAWAGVALNTDYPTPAAASVVFAAAVVVAMLWRFAPDAVAPVRYGHGTSAHLDLGGARGEAIRAAVADQLGLTVTEVEPFGLAGSGGSSPMRLHLEGDVAAVFAKLFSAQHVRADRDYKLIRALMYGRLEDERPFTNVQRLVEHEDYLMRVFRDAGAPVVRSYGFVEITPGREYMLVTDFAENAREIGDDRVQVDDAVIDDGLRTIRVLWDAGLAHRDVKPANLLVANGRIVLIDLGFAQVRPTPWRQAVDLANMCLCLAARTDTRRVYDAALRYFTPDDLAEAFAATKGLTVPTQLQSVLKADPRDLVGEFRALAPARDPIPIQRWSVRRVGLLAAVLAGLVAVLAAASAVFFSYDPEQVRAPECATSTPVLLFGQAVPTAKYVPCVDTVPTAWSVRDAKAEDGHGSFVVDAGSLGTATITLQQSCGEGAVPFGGGVPNLGVEASEAQTGPHRAQRSLRFGGGCVRIEYTFDNAREANEWLHALSFGTARRPGLFRMIDRARLDEAARHRTDGHADELTRV